MLRARVSLAARLFAAASLLVACDHNLITPAEPAPPSFTVKLGGALEASFDKNVTDALSQVLLLAPEGHPASLAMRFLAKVKNGNREDVVNLQVTFPINISQNHPGPGIYEHRYEDHTPYSGILTYSLVVQDASGLQALHEFRGDSMQLRIEESTAGHVKGDLFVEAKQVRGLMRSYGQLQDQQLANEGRIIVAVKFEAPLVRQ